MRKLFFSIVPVLLIMAACTNKPGGAAAMPIHDTIYIHDTIWQSKTSGSVPVTAQVFEDATLKPIVAAAIAAREADKLVETVSSDTKGMYAYSKLLNDHTYVFTTTKEGFVTQSQTAKYEGTNSLPGFAMKKIN